MPDLDLRCERDFGSVITDAIAMLGAHAGQFFPALAAIVAVPIVAEEVVEVALGGDSLPGPFDLFDPAVTWLVGTATLAYLLLYEEGFLERGEPLDLSALWRAMRPLLWPVAAVQLLGFGSLVLLGTLAYRIGVASGSLSVGIAAGLIAFGVVIVVYPGFALAVPAAVMEGGGPVASLRRGYALSKDYFLQTVALLIVVQMLRSVVVRTTKGASHLAATQAESAWEPLGVVIGSLASVSVTLVSALLGTVFYAVLMLQYTNLVERIDAPSLDGRIEDIGMPDETPLF